MKYIALILLCLVSVAMAADDLNIDSYSVSMGGSGSVIAKTSAHGITSTGDVGFVTGGDRWNEWTANSHIITQQGGYSTYDNSEDYNATQTSVYTGKTRLSSSTAAVTDNEYYMEDNKPNTPEISCEASAIVAGLTATAGNNPSHQFVDIHKTGMFGYGDYESNAIIDDANVTSDTSHEFGGGGLFLEDTTTDTEVGANKNTSVMNFKKSQRTHFGRINDPDANETSTFISDYKHRDMSVPFGIGNETANSTFQVNLTT